jgi:hypothetical protein
MTWTHLSSAPDGGPPPTARYFHGFTSGGGFLYVHGGKGYRDTKPGSEFGLVDVILDLWSGGKKNFIVRGLKYGGTVQLFSSNAPVAGHQHCAIWVVYSAYIDVIGNRHSL